MKPRNTYILLFVAVALAAYIFFWDNKIPSTRSAFVNDRTLAQFDESKITGMDISNGDSVIKVRKENDEWLMVSPVKDRANASSIQPILQAAANLDRLSAIDNSGEGDKSRGALKDYGLKKGKIRLQLYGENAPPVFHFGKDTAFEGKIYARLDSDSRVSVVSGDLRNLLAKDVSEFRDHRLTDFPATSVSGVTFKTSAGEIDLLQTGDDWHIAAPLKARAANSKVLDLIANVNNLAIQEFIPQDETSLAKFGLAEPRGAITFSAKDRDEKTSIEIGNATEKDPTKIYVQVPGRPSIFVVAKSLGDALAVKPNDLRDNKLTRVSEDFIDRLIIEKPGQPSLLLVREEENWKLKTGEQSVAANNSEVKHVIDILNNTEANFVADTASDLTTYGLDAPVLTVRLSSYASDNTAESAKGEQPLATVQFGKTDGDKVYARLAEEPFIVSVPVGILTNIASDSAAYLPVKENSSKPTSAK